MVDERAWNNFVLLSDPSACIDGSRERAAAIANCFMGAVNNGGLNSFLTVSFDLDADEVVHALAEVGAQKASKQLTIVIQGLGAPVPISTQEERWALLDRSWTEDLDQYDALSGDAADELVRVLEKHVSDNEAHYLGLASKPSDR